MNTLDDLKVRLFADGANLADIAELNQHPRVSGFTTNPSLMRRAGVRNYQAFARQLLQLVPDKPVSLEVFADDFQQMEQQAWELASWGPNVNVKIPVTNTHGESSGPLIQELLEEGIQVNVTAILALDHVESLLKHVPAGAQGFVSIFAGRIADTGVDPLPTMSRAVELLREHEGMQLIWASPRQLLDVFLADRAGCDAITLSPELLGKLSLFGRDLSEYSLATVRMFYEDACRAGYEIATVEGWLPDGD